VASKNERLLDTTGRRILRELQENARLTMSELGKRVNLSAPAVAERVRRMEDAGIITSYRATVDPAKLGAPITAFIRLEEAARSDGRVIALARELPEVLECHAVTGGEGFVIKVAVRSVEHLEAVIYSFTPHGRPITSVVLSSPVAARPYPVTEPDR
jgi:Lrp/AsnC family transcriptional regulator, leucine-responsive regulatory protein